MVFCMHLFVVVFYLLKIFFLFFLWLIIFHQSSEIERINNLWFINVFYVYKILCFVATTIIIIIIMDIWVQKIGNHSNKITLIIY